MVRIAYIIERESSDRPTGGVGYHRLEIPMAYLSKEYPDLKITEVNGFTEDYGVENFDVVIFNRFSKHSFFHLESAKEKGVKVILDLDDYWNIPEWHTNNNDYVNEIFKQNILKNLSFADEIWAASKFLQDKIRTESGREAIYIPNGIGFDEPQFIPQKQPSPMFMFGYLGAASHHRDVLKMAEPFADLYRTGRKDYGVTVCGYTEQSKEYWDLIEKVLSTNYLLLQERRFGRHNALDVYNYAYMYNFIDCSLAPLCSDDFSQSKSSLKVIEAGAFNLPIVVSDVAPYKEFIDLDLVYNGGKDSKSFYKCLKDIVTNKDKARLKGEKLGQYVRENYNIEKLNKVRYESIISITSN